MSVCPPATNLQKAVCIPASADGFVVLHDVFLRLALQHLGDPELASYMLCDVNFTFPTMMIGSEIVVEVPYDWRLVCVVWLNFAQDACTNVTINQSVAG